MNFKQLAIRSPSSKNEYDAYYLLRWKILRAPWNKSMGSEKDELEENSIHRLAILNNVIIGCGRIHFVDQQTAQIRYMAISEDFIGKGIGKKILTSLEDAARDNDRLTIILNARENAVSFYKKCDYQLIEKSHLLYNKIQHYKMIKNLSFK